jgi:hypothetical protein
MEINHEVSDRMAQAKFAIVRNSMSVGPALGTPNTGLTIKQG